MFHFTASASGFPNLLQRVILMHPGETGCRDLSTVEDPLISSTVISERGLVNQPSMLPRTTLSNAGITPGTESSMYPVAFENGKEPDRVPLSKMTCLASVRVPTRSKVASRSGFLSPRRPCGF